MFELVDGMRGELLCFCLYTSLRVQIPFNSAFNYRLRLNLMKAEQRAAHSGYSAHIKMEFNFIRYEQTYYIIDDLAY